MVLYLGRMFQYGLHAVLWSDIGIIIRFLAAEHRSNAGSLFLSQCLCGTIVLILYSILWEWEISRVAQWFFVGLSCSIHFCLLLFFPFCFVYMSTVWYCGDGVFWALHCLPLLTIITIIIMIIITTTVRIIWKTCCIQKIELFLTPEQMINRKKWTSILKQSLSMKAAIRPLK